MANPYFQFKQFRIEQDQCGMKVSTDACILGAYTSCPTAKTALDIGTGTALLSLMLAQRHPHMKIDAVEIEPLAFEQARKNISNSTWSDRVNIFLSPVQSFSPAQTYDLIICNPPFYPKHLQSANLQRRKAFHQESLNFQELAQSFRRLLSGEGEAFVLLPPLQAEEFSREAQKLGLYLAKELTIRDRPQLEPHRCIRSFTFLKTEQALKETLSIKEEEGQYSPAFRKLMEPYYLIF